MKSDKAALHMFSSTVPFTVKPDAFSMNFMRSDKYTRYHRLNASCLSSFSCHCNCAASSACPCTSRLRTARQTTHSSTAQQKIPRMIIIGLHLIHAQHHRHIDQQSGQLQLLIISTHSRVSSCLITAVQLPSDKCFAQSMRIG